MLRVAVSEGRISLEELHERLDRTYATRTCGELDAIVADLPREGAQPYPSDVLRLHARRGTRIRQLGHWVVPPRISLTCAWGNAKIDFREAECRHREVSLEVVCDSRFGDIFVVVPYGWWVRSDEVVARGWGGVHNKPPEPPVPDGVVLRLSGRVSGDIWVKYRRRRA